MLTTKRRVRRKISPNVSRQRAWQIKQREQDSASCAPSRPGDAAPATAEHRAEHNEREKARYQRKINPPPPPSLW